MIGRFQCVVCWRWAGRNLLCRHHRQSSAGRPPMPDHDERGQVRCEPAFGSCALPSGHEGMHSQDGPFRGQPTHVRDLEET